MGLISWVGSGRVGSGPAGRGGAEDGSGQAGIARTSRRRSLKETHAIEVVVVLGPLQVGSQPAWACKVGSIKRELDLNPTRAPFHLRRNDAIDHIRVDHADPPGGIYLVVGAAQSC